MRNLFIEKISQEVEGLIKEQEVLPESMIVKDIRKNSSIFVKVSSLLKDSTKVAYPGNAGRNMEQKDSTELVSLNAKNVIFENGKNMVIDESRIEMSNDSIDTENKKGLKNE